MMRPVVRTLDSSRACRGTVPSRGGRVLLAMVAALLSTSGSAHADTIQVGVSSNVFSPVMVTIDAGDSVLWVNVQGVHNVVADDGSFTSGSPAPPPWFYTRTFDEPGTYPYFCELHGAPGGIAMAGIVVVQGSGANPGMLQVAAGSAAVGENEDTVVVGVDRVNGSAGAVSVSFDTLNGSALAGFDYTAAAGTLSWADGDTASKSVTVSLLDDAEIEGPETFSVTLSDPTGGASLAADTTTVTILDDDQPPPTSCDEDENTLCLLDDRFQIQVDFTRPGLPSDRASAVPFTDRAGLFYFFNPDNLEMLIKMLDACALNDRFWVFYAATTNVELTVTVTDTESGSRKTYFNPQGTAAPPVQDTQAFATCP